MPKTYATGRIVCFGELMLRFTPPGPEILLQSAAMAVHPGGAEANVAVALARLGAEAAWASVLPDNPLGRAARDEVRRAGTDTSGVRMSDGRMGLYFVSPGAVRRPSEVLYDRAGSAFAEQADTLDWAEVLEGAEWLHISGVTPAVGPKGAAAALAITEAAVAAGVKVSFDGNFRGKLWALWESDPPRVLSALMATASIAFVDDRDIALMLGRPFEPADAMDRRRAAAEVAFDTFPRLERVACTVRTQTSVADQTLSAVMFTRSGEHHAPAIDLAGVVDRIGGGDAFAAGVLFGVAAGQDDARSLALGLALSGLKHSITGDFSPFTLADVEAAMEGGGLDVRR
ncbi:2-keto-3-deoxygluconate kinase [Brevundimonas sp. Leaf363]|uniref:sugar kinase n=1 Tax=Brevundimonas sp. Leaf363 TaxID=1736353 RepID=UPI0006FD1CC8|nr:sugar kinase [Brevundimonas sp. Leaf363]KQS54266.1 2-keto-3-deoxygluconate kinase [Brevundimonas sp. Leaf363]